MWHSFSKPKALLSLCLLSILSTPASAYWIDDETCNTNAKADVIHVSMGSAVAMIQRGQDMLENLNQQDPKIQTLAQLIFGDANGINGARQFFTRVGNAFNQNGARIPSNIPDRLRFFCDTSFLEVQPDMAGPGRPMTYDFRHEQFINGDISLGGAHDHAVTYSDTQIGQVTYSVTVIQPRDIAIWQGRTDMSITSLVARIKSNQEFSKGEDVADNICSTPDVTVAHELFHTNMAMQNAQWNTRAIDAPGCDTSPSDWQNIRTCAQNGNGWQNADSLAYFACLSTVVQELGWRVFDNGRVRGFGS